MHFIKMLTFCFEREEHKWADNASESANFRRTDFQLITGVGVALWLQEEDIVDIWLDVRFLVNFVVVER